MPKANIYLVLDTETADFSGNVYDVGYTLANKRGEILREYNALVRETFTDWRKMMGAYYAKKIFTHYADMLQDGRISLQPWGAIVARLRADIEATDANIACAYNAGFDFRVMRNTHFALGNTDHVLGRKMKVIDLWQFACETQLTRGDYIKMALENGWVTEKGNISTGAEFAYRYLTRNAEFSEDHTALSDARIETHILAACLKTKKRVPYGVIDNSPWRIVADAAARYREKWGS